MSDPIDGFDIDDPKLPEAIKKKAMRSGGYPYADKLELETYEAQMYELQKQLVLLQAHLLATEERVMVVFEGRDAAGKGGTIKTYLTNLNPRHNLIAALPKPNDRQSTQWYFQRYVEWMPAGGETVLFDRSWYNRAGVERVMGYATPEQVQHFLKEAPEFERSITNDGIHLFKFWLSIGREMQLKRFHDRRHDPLKVWKLSPIDIEALGRWDAYTEARNAMFEQTDVPHAPWRVVRSNDKRRGRLNLIRTVLHELDFAGKDLKAIGDIDPLLVMDTKTFMAVRDQH